MIKTDHLRYRGYHLRPTPRGWQIWTGQDCICTESTKDGAKAIIDGWLHAA